MSEQAKNIFRVVYKLVAAFFITLVVFMAHPAGIEIVAAILYQLFDAQSLITLIGCTLSIIVLICRGCFAFQRIKKDIGNHYKQDNESVIRIKSIVFLVCLCIFGSVVAVLSYILLSSFCLPVLGAIFIISVLLLTWYRIWKQNKNATQSNR